MNPLSPALMLEKMIRESRANAGNVLHTRSGKISPQIYGARMGVYLHEFMIGRFGSDIFRDEISIAMTEGLAVMELSGSELATWAHDCRFQARSSIDASRNGFQRIGADGQGARAQIGMCCIRKAAAKALGVTRVAMDRTQGDAMIRYLCGRGYYSPEVVLRDVPVTAAEVA